VCLLACLPSIPLIPPFQTGIKGEPSKEVAWWQSRKAKELRSAAGGVHAQGSRTCMGCQSPRRMRQLPTGAAVAARVSQFVEGDRSRKSSSLSRFSNSHPPRCKRGWGAKSGEREQWRRLVKCRDAERVRKWIDNTQSCVTHWQRRELQIWKGRKLQSSPWRWTAVEGAGVWITVFNRSYK
jgi:hypothetical protein